MKKIYQYILLVTGTVFIIASLFVFFDRPKKYSEIRMLTNKIGEGRNDVQGIILHHTGENDLWKSLFFLYNNPSEASSHLVIGKDGTRYILAPPEAITWHAGYSILNGREKCNDFTIGIEFQGNTEEQPLSEDQINSAIEYIMPLMEKYHIRKQNIVTHAMIRSAWLKRYPHRAVEKHVEEKIDITPDEYQRFMEILDAKLR